MKRFTPLLTNLGNLLAVSLLTAVMATPVMAQNCSHKTTVRIEPSGRNNLLGCGGGSYAQFHETAINIKGSGGAICRDDATARVRITGAPTTLQWHNGTSWSYVPAIWEFDVQSESQKIRIRPGGQTHNVDNTWTLRLEKATPMNGSLPQDAFNIDGPPGHNLPPVRQSWWMPQYDTDISAPPGATFFQKFASGSLGDGCHGGMPEVNPLPEENVISTDLN